MTTVLPLLKNVLTLLVESVLVPLGLTTGVSAKDAPIQYKIVVQVRLR